MLTKGGRLTVVSAFNRISGPGPPWGVPVLAIPLVIHGHSEEAETDHDGEVQLINDERELIRSIPFKFTFPASSVPGLPVRSIVNLVQLGASFDAPGLYVFEVYIDGTYMAAASLVIAQS